MGIVGVAGSMMLLIASVLVWVTSAVTTLIISHKIKTINMVEALKGVE
ncbi:hypothetical protein [Streptococcus infantarius]|nr:hypothetical protein [Streptococcus infantarius]